MCLDGVDVDFKGQMGEECWECLLCGVGGVLCWTVSHMSCHQTRSHLNSFIFVEYHSPDRESYRIPNTRSNIATWHFYSFIRLGNSIEWLAGGLCMEVQEASIQNITRSFPVQWHSQYSNQRPLTHSPASYWCNHSPLDDGGRWNQTTAFLSCNQTQHLEALS